MVNQMVSRFRVKKLSPKHPLPVYKEYQLPDLSDAANIQRAVPQIETGVEKEEEEEHDLQAAISAAQAAVTTGADVERYIPTPDASRLVSNEEYTALYKKKHKDPSTLIRFSSTVEDCIGCPYFMDEEDDSFLEDYNKQYPGEALSEDSFENIMWELESITNQQWPHLALDPQIPEYEVFLEHVPGYSKLKSIPNLSVIYSHWSKRRQKREGKSVTPSLKFEEAYKNEMDPYVCFRRRETKPARKTRRSDQQSLERLRRLRLEMEMARNLLERVLRREKIRKESLVVEHAVFEKKCALYEYQRILGIKEDEDLLLPKKKQKTSLEGSGATIKISLHKLKSNFRFDKSPTQIAIEAELSRKREADAPYEDITESGCQLFASKTPQLFYQPLSVSGKTSPAVPRFRKRLGRGGRLFIDRIGFSSGSSGGGKTKPGSPSYDPYRFDSDISDNEDNEVEIDEMDSLFLKHRAQLLSETELRNLVTVPFLTPNNIMSLNQVRHAAAAFNNSDSRMSQALATRGQNQQQQSQQPAAPTNGTTISIKRQNSGRTKMTPQQASVAMASGMIAANMTAAVHNPSNTGKAAIQMAMAAAQHQQQLNNMNKTNYAANPPLPLHF